MKHHVLFLKVHDSSSLIFEAFQTLSQLSVTVCFGLDELRESLQRHPPEFVFLGESLPEDVATQAIELLGAEYWFIPVLQLCARPELEVAPRHPAWVPVSPALTPEEVGTLLDEQASRWTTWQPIEPLDFRSYLHLPLSTGSGMICQLRLANRELALLEISEGHIWAASFGRLQGEEALEVLGDHLICEIKERKITGRSAKGRKLRLPFAPLQTTHSKPTPPPLLMELETQTHLDAVKVDEFIWLSEEKLSSTDTHQAFRPEGDAQSEGPEESLFRAWQKLVSNQPAEAQFWAQQFARQSPDDPRLRFDFLSKLARDRGTNPRRFVS